MITKTILQLCGVAAVAFFPLSSTLAQAADAADSKAGRPMLTTDQRLDVMKKKVDLSDDQVAKLKTIFEEQKAAVDPIRSDTTLSKEQKREKLKPIMEDTKTKVNAVLTPEQQAKVAAARKEHREKKGAGQ